MIGNMNSTLFSPMRYRVRCFAAMCALLATSAFAQFGDNPFSVKVDLAKSPTEGAPSVTVSFSVPPEHILYAEELSVSADAATLTPQSIPDPKQKVDPFSEEKVSVYDHDFDLVYSLNKTAAFPLSLTVAYQGCNDTLCFMPQTETFELTASGRAVQEVSETNAVAEPESLLDGFQVIGRDSGFIKSADFIAFLDRVEAGKGVEKNVLRAMLAERGIVVMVLAILFGGFLLNLTPCVLPMIPVNIAIIGAGTQAGSRSRGFALGATYGLGIAFVYGVLGVVVVLTGSQFGALNASAGFNIAIAVLFLALALSMFGLFNIDFSRFQSGGAAKANRGPFATAFIFGGVAALLAGACVAPMLIGVLVFSTEIYQRGAVAGLLLPFLLGVGMALPWPFAGAGLSFLPKPGQWMERIKKGFGVVILVASVYYGQLGVRLLMPVVSAPEPAAPTDTSFTWQTSLEEALALSRTTGKPLFIDVWATWCKSCKAMSRTTFKDPEVLARLSGYIPLKFQAEEPVKNLKTRRILEALGVRGQPYYIVLQPE